VADRRYASIATAGACASVQGMRVRQHLPSSTTAKAIARNVTDRRYASITACGASLCVCARYAGAPASATTNVKRARARSVADRRYASITAEEASARQCKVCGGASICHHNCIKYICKESSQVIDSNSALVTLKGGGMRGRSRGSLQRKQRLKPYTNKTQTHNYSLLVRLMR
jgi:hypothetical protein